MENKNNNDHNSGNGFLFGLIIGSVATLLFTTKKGREILKEITERGIESISELERKLKNAEELVVIEEENDYSEPEMRPIPDSVQVDEKEKEKLAKIEEKLEKASGAKKATIPTPKQQKNVRRFFKKKV